LVLKTNSTKRRRLGAMVNGNGQRQQQCNKQPKDAMVTGTGNGSWSPFWATTAWRQQRHITLVNNRMDKRRQRQWKQQSAKQRSVTATSNNQPNNGASIQQPWSWSAMVNGNGTGRNGNGMAPWSAILRKNE
jgi:hypothetical protein